MTITRRDTVTLAEIDEALTTLCQMLARAVNAPDLPNVRRFSERIDELLDARMVRAHGNSPTQPPQRERP
jgi:hypothetical protein